MASDSAPKLKMAKRTAWVDLPGRDEDGQEAYPGFKVKIWVNYPSGLIQEVRSGDSERAKTALKKIVLEHNGWGDIEGNEFPEAQTDEFWEAIPNELAAAVITLVQMEATKLPNYLQLMK